MKKLWSLIPNQLNIEEWNWKKNQLYKRIKKVFILRMMIKIEKQNKFYIWLNVEIKKNKD